MSLAQSIRRQEETLDGRQKPFPALGPMPLLKPEFNLKALLEKLNNEELRSFTSLLKILPEAKDDLQEYSYEVEEANVDKLAEILTNKFPSSRLRNVTLHILEKMNCIELSRIPEVPQAPGTDEPVLKDTEEDVEMDKPDKTDKCRNIMEKLCQVWRSKFHGEDGDHLHNVTERSQALIPLSLQTAAELSSAVVLYGPAGNGKTTVAKEYLLGWVEGSLGQPAACAFYLSCRELNHMAPCSFAELISKYCPELQDDVADLLAQEVLFVVDGFEELRVPAEALTCDVCTDWKTPKPAPILLSSLLKRKLVPEARLLVTTQPWALRDLLALLERPHLVEIKGFSEQDRQEYFLRRFGSAEQAQRALDAMKGNAALHDMGSAPAVCWAVCTCLQSQVERGEDPAPTCQTTTSLFLRFLCGQFPRTPGSCAHGQLRAPLEALCRLAAQGLWTQLTTFDEDDLGRLGMKEADLLPFLDKRVLRRAGACGRHYAFLHLGVQQLLAAAFYLLRREAAAGAGPAAWDIEGARELFSREARARNPSLAQAARFLCGLLSEKRAQELEATFGCQTSLEVKRELLQGRSQEEKPCLWLLRPREVFSCLYEAQDEGLMKEAMAPLEEMTLDVQSDTDLMHSSFCLKHCQNLQKISLQVAKGVFPKNDAALESYLRGVRSLPDNDTACLWVDFCSVVCSNKNLTTLDISQSFLSDPSVRILCDYVTRVSCCLQNVVIRNVSPMTVSRDFGLALIGKRSLTHLTLDGYVLEDAMLLLLLLGEMLKHEKCQLQCLRLGSCSATTQQWADFFLTLQVNKSLTCLDLSNNKLLDEGAKLLCETLRHPKCFLQRLSLENCHLTEASCREISSTLMLSQTLTHLSLAKNELGDGGMKILCEGLYYPECKLQTLVLRDCNITKRGCKHLSKLLQEDCSLTNLDLGLNPITVGLWLLCDALRNPNFNLKCLGLWGCSITSLYCQELASALTSNQNLEILDLGQNVLGSSGVIMLLEALKDNSGPLKTLRLKTDDFNMELQKLLEDVKESNPSLRIESVTGPDLPSYCAFFP